MDEVPANKLCSESAFLIIYGMMLWQSLPIKREKSYSMWKHLCLAITTVMSAALLLLALLEIERVVVDPEIALRLSNH